MTYKEMTTQELVDLGLWPKDPCPDYYAISRELEKKYSPHRPYYSLFLTIFGTKINVRCPECRTNNFLILPKYSDCSTCLKLQIEYHEAHCIVTAKHV